MTSELSRLRVIVPYLYYASAVCFLPPSKSARVYYAGTAAFSLPEYANGRALAHARSNVQKQAHGICTRTLKRTHARSGYDEHDDAEDADVDDHGEVYEVEKFPLAKKRKGNGFGSLGNWEWR